MKNQKLRSFRLKPLLLSVAAAGLISGGPLMSNKAHAMMPITDIGNFIQAMWADINRTMESAMEIEMLASMISTVWDTSADEIEATNNQAANIISRLEDVEKRKQLLDLEERMQSAQDSCDTFNYQTSLKDATCGALDTIDGIYSAKSEAIMVSTGDAAPVCDDSGGCEIVQGRAATGNEIDKFNRVRTRSVVDECTELSGSSGSLCQNAGLITSGKPLTKEEYRAVELQNEIAAGVAARAPSTRQLQPGTDAYNIAKASDLRRAYFEQSASAGRDHVNLLMNGTLIGNQRNRGEVQLMEDFIAQRMDPNWLCEVGNTCPDERPPVPPAELARRAIQIDVVMMDIAAKHYKSSLRIEKYLADLVQLEVQPLQ